MTPLHYAVNREYPDVVQVLLDHGADVNIRDDVGYFYYVVIRV